MVLKYLLWTTVAGGLVGATHGAMTLHRVHPTVTDPYARAFHVSSHTQAGALMGPWMPFLVVAWFRVDRMDSTKCPIMKGGARFLSSPTSKTDTDKERMR